MPALVACTTGARGEQAPVGRTRASADVITISTVPPASELREAVSPATPDLSLASAKPVGEDTTSTLTLLPTNTPSPLRSATSLTGTATVTPAPSRSPTATPTATIAGSPTATPSPTRTPDPSVLSDAEGKLLDAHNQARQEHGLGQLVPNPTLMSIARQRARYMADNNSLTHYGPNGATVFNLMNTAGYAYGDGAENIHYNYGYSEDQSLQVAMQDYLASPSHRAAILKPGFRRIGIGIAVTASGTRYYSIVFSD